MKYKRLLAALLALILCFIIYSCPSLPEAAAAPAYDEVFVIVPPFRCTTMSYAEDLKAMAYRLYMF